jgi:hypothetical protein
MTILTMTVAYITGILYTGYMIIHENGLVFGLVAGIFRLFNIYLNGKKSELLLIASV